ncbi:semaphorin-3B isoform X2 [Latimeria chalumnae]|uniref:semaphorin-3B isoform X2 n=1 Tax=Latimeria chalumnae TaxID=7897 RepID=UPI0003C11F75|nr:PREDICTED: semaphorin-3B isoform X2 [Latimeria chalumnae]|eukprot:XP_005996380.1 PREDICTED: semaphorin-3B isoform X2 [Latimeria chalumnae]
MDLVWKCLIVLLFLTCGFPSRGSSSKTNPRLKLSYQDLQSFYGLRTYEVDRSCCYKALLLDEERGRLFVGAKNFLLSLSLDNINKQDQKIYWPAPVEWREECNWAGKDINEDCMNFIKVLHPYNRTHLYACGTGAFHPVCAFVDVGQRMDIDFNKVEDGKGKSPYDPKHQAATVLVGHELYSGVATDLMGRDFTIFRSLGRRNSIRTEQHDSRWLNEPKFIDVFWIPESDNPDDDKIYFFFRETAVEAQRLGKASFSRIGQICRNDVGGQRSLVNKWTTFLKARLICSVPGNEGMDTYFDELRDIFILPTRDRKNPLIYAVFSTSSTVFKGSAICLYTMNDIRRAFLGPFAHKEGPNYQWVPYQGKVPYPRPGMCPSKTFGSFESTKEFPDEVIQFARNHPLMYHPVQPVNNRPILVKTNTDYSFTQIAVDRVAAADGQYDVMFIGTDVGSVLKVISVPKESWQSMEELVLEEIQVFQNSTPITSMQISSKRQQLYLGSDTMVTQLPLHRCSIYGKACAECCLARDPYCAWDGNSCTRYLHNTKRRFRRQNVRNGDPNVLCSGDHQRQRVPEKKLYGVEGSSTFLECIPKSLQAQVTWTFQKSADNHRDELQTDDRRVKTDRGILLRDILRKDSGIYSCQAMELGFSQTLLHITLEVISAQQVDELVQREAPRGRAPASQKVWYQDFLQLLDHPNLNTVDQICEQVWRRKNRQSKQKPPPPPVSLRTSHKKWKHLQEIRKGRNRRTHEAPRKDRAPRSATIW